MASGYEQLAVQYIEIARGITGDQSQARLNAYIGSSYTTLALLEELRQSGAKRGARARLSLLTLRADPCAQPLRPEPTYGLLRRSTQKKSAKKCLRFLMGPPR
jgi:hypothetical protein